MQLFEIIKQLMSTWWDDGAFFALLTDVIVLTKEAAEVLYQTQDYVAYQAKIEEAHRLWEAAFYLVQKIGEFQYLLSLATSG